MGGLRVRMREITRANYHSITGFDVGQRVAMQKDAAVEDEEGGQDVLEFPRWR